MNTLQSPPNTSLILAQLLERLDRAGKVVDAHQYRLVAQRLSAGLADPSIDWTLLLEQSPAAAELYENLHYAHAGLCRSRLDAAARAEVLAREAIERARRERESDARGV